MSDPLRKVQPGDPLKISAGTFNTFIDAAQDFQQRQRSQQQRPRSSFTDHGTVLVRNDSGAGRERFDVLGISPWCCIRGGSPSGASGRMSG